jgi:serine/threonine protein kinase
VQLTVAPHGLDKAAVYIKRTGLKFWPEFIFRGRFIRNQLLQEALTMERICKSSWGPHPCIVQYHGCRIHRGRITNVVLENVGEHTLDYIAYCEPDRSIFEGLDRDAFIAGVESAVTYLHSLGMAHNDINPYNIMVRLC